MVWEQDRLAFQRLQQHSPGAGEAARQWPAHYVVFDLLHGGGPLTGWPYERRRGIGGPLFADHGLTTPLTLCPSTTTRRWCEGGWRGRRPGWKGCVY
ncbi:hypothetical protein ACU639_36145 [Streptomyces cynarae]|uniref:hypothetical protein n=1 Tax=Streptomyces cynarae TaxID=2981134 RepID=UPI00406C3912